MIDLFQGLNDYELIARDARWTEQTTEAWRSRYQIRSGVEATISELKRGHGLGRLRVRGLARVRIQIGLKTTACNIKRWLRALPRLLNAFAATLCPVLRLFAPFSPIDVQRTVAA